MDEGEAMSLFEALSLVKHRGVEEVIFQIDSQNIHLAVSSKISDDSKLGTIIKNCITFLESNISFRAKHVRKENNDETHYLTRSSINYLNPHVWNETLLILWRASLI